MGSIHDGPCDYEEGSQPDASGSPSRREREALSVMQALKLEQASLQEDIKLSIKVMIHENEALRRERDSLIGLCRTVYGREVTYSRTGLASFKRRCGGDRYRRQ